MMSGEAWLYLLAVLINAVNLFLQVFFTIMYSDLEWYVKYPTSGIVGPGYKARRIFVNERSRSIQSAHVLPCLNGQNWLISFGFTAITSILSICVTDSTPTSSLKPPYMAF